MDERRDLLLVDGNHLFWRASSAAMLSVDGSPTGGIYAFIRALVRVHERFGGMVVVCWEGGSHSQLVRRHMYAGYKARRHTSEDRVEMVATIVKQSDRLRRLLSLMGITQITAPGWEADDAMATMAAWGEAQGHRCGIFTGDSDLWQCATKSTFIIRPLPKDIEVITPEVVRERLGVEPYQVPLLKALAGDKSDGIPGVNGIGNVAAARLVELARGVPALLRLAEAGEKPAIKRFSDRAWSALRASASSGELRLWWRLARINRSAELVVDRSEWNKSGVIRLLIELKFKTLMGHRELHKLHKLAGRTGMPDGAQATSMGG